MKKLIKYLKKAIPWIFALLIFAYLFSKYPPSQIYNSLKLLNIWFFVTFAVAYFLIMFVVDSFSIAHILSHFGHPNSTREILPARGLTYLIMVINYAASQAAFAFYQYRKHKVSISEMMGIFGIIVFIDLYLLTTLAFVTTFFQSWPFDIAGMPIGTFVRIFTLCGYSFLIINIAFWNGWLAKIPVLCHLVRIFDKLRDKSFFSVLRRSSFKDYFYVALLRLPVHALIIMSLYVVALTFNAHIPFLKIMANTPLIFFIGAIPLTPGGLGTSNAALVELLKPYVTSQAINSGIVSAGDLLFAMSLTWMFANYFLKALTGLISIKFTSRNLFKPTCETETQGEVEASTPSISGNL